MRPQKPIAVALSVALVAGSALQAPAASLKKTSFAAPPKQGVVVHSLEIPDIAPALALPPTPGVAAPALAALPAASALQPAAPAAVPEYSAIAAIEDRIARTDSSPDDLSAAGLDLERQITGEMVNANAAIVARSPEFIESGKHDALAHAMNVLSKASPYSPEFRRFLYSSRHRAALETAVAAGGAVGAKADALQARLNNILSPDILKDRRKTLLARVTEGALVTGAIVSWIGLFATHVPDLALVAMVLTLFSVAYDALGAPLVQSFDVRVALERYEKYFNFYNKTTAMKKKVLAKLGAMVRRQRKLDATLRPLIAVSGAQTGVPRAPQGENQSLESGVERLLKHPHPPVRKQALAQLEELIALAALEAQARDGDPKDIVQFSEYAGLLRHAYPDKDAPQLQRYVLWLVEKWLIANKIETKGTLSHIEDGLSAKKELDQLEEPRP